MSGGAKRPRGGDLGRDRRALLDTGGGVAKALPLLGPGPFLHLNSNSFWIEGARPNLDWLAAAWDDAIMDALLLLAPTVRAIGYSGPGDFRLDPAGRLSRRPEREVAPFAYAGAAILHPRLFDGCPEGAFSLNRLFDEAIETERLFGIRMDGVWLHVGTPDAITAAEVTIRRQRRLTGAMAVAHPKVFTIPAGAPFLPALADASFQGGWRACRLPDPLALADVTILLPTRRAVRALREVFIARLGGEAAILPAIRPIGDVERGGPPLAGGRGPPAGRFAAGRLGSTASSPWPA